MKALNHPDHSPWQVDDSSFRAVDSFAGFGPNTDKSHIPIEIQALIESYCPE